MNEIDCPLCLQSGRMTPNTGTVTIECRICGEYGITNSLYAVFDQTAPKERKRRPYLSAATRQSADQGQRLVLTTDNVTQHEQLHKTTPVSQKLDKLLDFIGKKCGRPGEFLNISLPLDYPIADCAGANELEVYVEHLKSEGLLQIKSHGGNAYSPTIEGWRRLEPSLGRGGEPDRCFVAMWFDDALDENYNLGFYKAISECGFKPHRVKEHPTNGAIIDQILAGIHRAHFTVADFTGGRRSVYYEAGFARGLGREVINCCREDWVAELAFDTQHLGHVVWRDSEDLCIKLKNCIEAVILPKR